MWTPTGSPSTTGNSQLPSVVSAVSPVGGRASPCDRERNALDGGLVGEDLQRDRRAEQREPDAHRPAEQCGAGYARTVEGTPAALARHVEGKAELLAAVPVPPIHRRHCPRRRVRAGGPPSGVGTRRFSWISCGTLARSVRVGPDRGREPPGAPRHRRTSGGHRRGRHDHERRAHTGTHPAIAPPRTRSPVPSPSPPPRPRSPVSARSARSPRAPPRPRSRSRTAPCPST